MWREGTGDSGSGGRSERRAGSARYGAIGGWVVVSSASECLLWRPQCPPSLREAGASQTLGASTQPTAPLPVFARSSILSRV